MFCFVLFPVNLYSEIINVVGKNDIIYLVEDTHFFHEFRYHKLKLAYHIATMEMYRDFLIRNGFKNVKYIHNYDVNNSFYSKLAKKYSEIKFFDFCADTREDSLFKILGNKMIIYDNFNFTLSRDEIYDNSDLFYNHTTNRYNFTQFYIFQRKRLGLLLDKNGNPIGGKWSFDNENRKNYKSDINPIKIPKTIINSRDNRGNSGDNRRNIRNKLINRAISRVNSEFPDNYGNCDIESFIYPIDFQESKKWLDNFIKNKLNKFGDYQDATHTQIPFGYHAVISPMMNIGILPDRLVIDTVMKYYNKNKKRISLSSIEGFIRQIIGWRNYVWAMYVLERDTLYNSNQWGQKNKINLDYWDKVIVRKVPIIPINHIINKFIKYSYAHHIERLMYIGTWFLINEVQPKEVYRMFMEWTIDAYDWVMVPNVTMTTNNTDIMMTRMYINSSNYIKKMSNFKCNDDVLSDDSWCEIWDELYRKFIKKHANKLKNNYATARQVYNVINRK